MIDLPKAALIDLDGTLIDSVSTADECWTALCQEYGARLGVDPLRLAAAIDVRRIAYWDDPHLAHIGRLDLHAATRQFVSQSFADLGLDRLDEACRLADGFRERRDRFVEVPGAVDVLKQLCSAGVRLALVTNGAGPVQRAKIEKFRLGQYFEHYLIEGELGFGKPDERVYRQALDRLGVPAAETWMVGDDIDWEVAAPQKLGVFSIWVNRSAMGTPRRDGIVPDRIISSFADLLG